MKKLLAAAIAALALATPSTAVGHDLTTSAAVHIGNDAGYGGNCAHGHCATYNYGCRINSTALWLRYTRYSDPFHKHQVKVDHDHPNGVSRYIVTVYTGWISGWPPAGCS